MMSTHTAADRIKQLNSIDQDVAKLLHSAGLAVKALTLNGQAATDDDSVPQSLENHKTAFTSASSQYFSLLSYIDVRLRRQIYALEEADIIFAERPARETLTVSTAPGSVGGISTAVPPTQTASGKANAAASGLGNLDVGWLNSRNDAVGKDMEAELWAKAKTFIQNLGSEKSLGNG